MRIFYLFLAIFIGLPTTIGCMDRPAWARTELPTSLQEYAAPTELQAHIDMVFKQSYMRKFGEFGCFSCVYEHPHVAGWLFKLPMPDSGVSIFKNLIYADIMQHIISTNNFKYIKIPQHYVYTYGDTTYILAEKITPSTRQIADLAIEEAYELILFIQLAHYRDCKIGANILITHQGLAVVDLDFLGCALMELENIRSIQTKDHSINGFFGCLPGLKRVLSSLSCTVKKQLLQKPLDPEILKYIQDNITYEEDCTRKAMRHQEQLAHLKTSVIKYASKIEALFSLRTSQARL